MTRFRTPALVAALAAGGLVAVYLALPWWSVPLCRALLGGYGVQLDSLRVGYPGWHTLRIEQLALRYPGNGFAVQLQTGEVRLRYRWSQLLHGRLESVLVTSAQLQWRPAPPAATAEASPGALPVMSPRALLERLPAQTIHIPTLNVDSTLGPGPQHLAGRLDYAGGVLDARLAAAPQWALQLHADGDNRLNFTLHRGRQPVASITSAVDAGRHISGGLQASLGDMVPLLRAFGVLPAQRDIDGSLQLSWHGELPPQLGAGSLRGLVLNGEVQGEISAQDKDLPATAKVVLKGRYQLLRELLTIQLKSFDLNGNIPAPAALDKHRDSLPVHAAAGGDTTLVVDLETPRFTLAGGGLAVEAGAAGGAMARLTTTEASLYDEGGWRGQGRFDAELGLDHFEAGVAARNLRVKFKGQVRGGSDEGSLELQPGAELSARTLQLGEMTTGAATLRSAKALTGRWQGRQLQLPAATLASAPLTLHRAGADYRVGAGTFTLRDAAVDLDAPRQAAAALGIDLRDISAPVANLRLRPATLRAQLQLAAQQLKGTWSVADRAGVYSVGGHLRHDLDSGRGEVSAALKPLQFRESGSYLPQVFDSWPYPLDFSGGEVTFKASADWRPGGAQARLRGTAQLAVKDVAGFYNLNLFKGLNAAVNVDYDDGKLRVPEFPVTLTEVDVGFPVQDLAVTASADERALYLRDLDAKLLGGRLRQPAIDYRWADPVHDFAVAFEGIDLGAVLGLEQSIAGSGTLDGTLPLRLSGAGLSVEGGELKARTPGGIISYQGELPLGAMASVPAMQLAVQALRNFHFTLLDLHTDYAVNGDLKLLAELHGRNPDMEEKRPIHFNLTVRENVPELLRSLQLGKDISDRIEQRVQSFYERQQKKEPSP